MTTFCSCSSHHPTRSTSGATPFTPTEVVHASSLHGSARRCRPVTPPRPGHRRFRIGRPRRQAPGAQLLDPDERHQLQRLERGPQQPGRLGGVRLQLVDGLLQHLPDNPFGFPFQNSCARHDFGYRNYKAAGTFSANKARIDSAFYEDLKRVCARYSGATKTSCNSTAWTYYQAVKIFGVSPADAGTRNLPQAA